MYDFLFVIIELFSLALTVETLQAEICGRERVGQTDGRTGGRTDGRTDGTDGHRITTPKTPL